ncbi:MAG TPA: LytR C-terminal domain-containing protein [Nocardioidaceae bacterium]|nr:LytR C-terminal domain-containing protein [Nocardioidaceae bacterium]
MASEVPNRRLATAVTLTGLIVVLVIFAVVGFNSLFAPIDEAPSGTSPTTCTPTQVPEGGKVKTADVTVSVFNASDRAGLASDTLTLLADRGFKLGQAGNAPDGTEVRFAQVWTSDRSDTAARLVARQFGPNTLIREHEDLGPGVDVIVGEEFNSLAADAPDALRSRETEEVCVGSE